jgi:hypothetical protein
MKVATGVCDGWGTHHPTPLGRMESHILRGVAFLRTLNISIIFSDIINVLVLASKYSWICVRSWIIGGIDNA